MLEASGHVRRVDFPHELDLEMCIVLVLRSDFNDFLYDKVGVFVPDADARERVVVVNWFYDLPGAIVLLHFLILDYVIIFVAIGKRKV